MSPETFDELLLSVQNLIIKENTAMRDAIPPKIKLTATILWCHLKQIECKHVWQNWGRENIGKKKSVLR